MCTCLHFSEGKYICRHAVMKKTYQYRHIQTSIKFQFLNIKQQTLVSSLGVLWHSAHCEDTPCLCQFQFMNFSTIQHWISRRKHKHLLTYLKFHHTTISAKPESAQGEKLKHMLHISQGKLRWKNKFHLTNYQLSCLILKDIKDRPVGITG